MSSPIIPDTSSPTITHKEFGNLHWQTTKRLPEAEESFNEYAEQHGLSSALTQKATEVRAAQGYDDYTQMLREAVTEYIRETEDGQEFEVYLENFENAVEMQRQKIESHALRDYSMSNPGNHERSYRQGRLQAMNAVKYCESLIEDLK